MKRLLVALFLLIVGAGQTPAEDRRTDPTRLVVMTFNALFMFDGVEPEEGGVHDIPWRGSQTEAEEHMAEIAEVVIAHDPDILNLVEVENLQALETLNTKFLTGRGYKTYLVDGTDTATGQDVGLLTRIDPEAGAIERDDRKGQSGSVVKGVSKNYFARFALGDRKIALVALHFLARPNDPDRVDVRQAQAAVIAQRAVDLAAEGYAPIVLGDFNDYDGQVPDHVGSQPITEVLPIVKRMQPGDAADDLINAAQFVPQSQRYTSFWDQDEDGTVDQPHELTSIDHILIAPALVPLVDSLAMPHELDPTEVSDHFPIVLHLRLDGGSGGEPIVVPPEPPAAPGGVVITRLLPNPPGDEDLHEEATLRNDSAAAVELAGYKLRDLAGGTWSLSGTIAPGESKSFKRDGQAMAMGNRGDTIDLVNPAGEVIDSIHYGRVDEGEEVLRL